MYRLIAYSVLVGALFLNLSLWFIEGIVNLIHRNQTAVLGGNPIGAATVVRWWAKGLLWLTGKGREALARYVHNNHPVVYRRFRAMLLPRR